MKFSLPIEEFQFRSTHSSGPGGQGVNTTNSAVELRWDINETKSLPEPVRQRLISLAGNRLSSDGTIVIEASEFRSQVQNKRAAIERLEALLEQAAVVPKIRHKTRVPLAQKQKRRLDKQRRSTRLANRKITE